MPVPVRPGPIVATAKVTDVGAQQFIGAQSRQQCGEDKGAVAFEPVAASPRLRVRIEGRQERGHRICRQCLRQRLRELGPADQGIGLAAISSEVYRNVHSTFQVDQHR